MASASTSTSLHELCTQWTSLADEQLTSDSAERLLKPLHDDLWVAAACVDRILDDASVQRSLLDLGIERTELAVNRSKEAFEHPSHSPLVGSDEEGDNSSPERPESSSRAAEKRRHASLVSYFHDEPADAQLCRIRAVLLDRLDRLNTFVEVCKEAPVAEETPEDAADEEWEDDPWGDGAAGPPSAPPSTAAGQPPLPLSSFLSTDLIELACLLASLEYFAALHIVMDRHASNLWPFRFVILDSIPEHAQASQFRDILPGYDALADSEQRPEAKPWRFEQDFSESIQVQQALNECGVPLDIQSSPNPYRQLSSRPEPLSATELAGWYRQKIDSVVLTGMIDASLSLVQHAASQGVPGLDEVGEELSLLSRLVYDAPGPEDALDVDWSLARWNAMEPPDVIRAYLAHCTPKTVAKDIGRLVMPYLFVLESRAERAGRPDPSLPNHLLYDYILSAPLDIVAAIFEASKPTLPPAQRLLRNDEDMARLALACLYGNDSLDDWPTMSRIFECLPAWDTPPEEEDEADEANATIDSLGAFVAPSTTRPRCTPAELLLFFKPLPMSSLSRALDVLDVHLESGEILARWSVPAPLRWFLQSNGNISEQRSWANRMARRAGGTDDKLETQDEWEWLLEDMLKLSGSGESTSRSAFCLLSRDDIIRTFFSGLLSTGKFDVAKSLLRSTNVQLSLDSQVIEDICLSCSQEFYDNASSGNYHFGDMKLAYDCLDVPERSEKIMKEKEFIEATSRLCSFNLMSRPGIPISPIEIRLTKDRLSLVSRVLSSNNDAYKHTQVILDLVYKLGFKGDIVAEVKTLAMLAETALQAEDFNRAYETSQRMVDTILILRSSAPLGLQDPQIEEASEVCWVACFQVGRHPEFPDLQKKMTLLGRAVELCPPERLPDVLGAWRRVEDEDIEDRRARLVSRRRGSRHANAPRQRAAIGSDAVSSLTARLQGLHMPELHMPHSPDAAALANKAFSKVAATFPFSVGSRERSLISDGQARSRSSSRTRVDGGDVSAQASRVLQKGIGWLLGADEDS